MNGVDNWSMYSLDDFSSAVNQGLTLMRYSSWDGFNNSSDWFMNYGLMDDWSYLEMMRFQITRSSSSNGQKSREKNLYTKR